MAKKVYYTGTNLWLRTFNFFEQGPDGKYTGVYGLVDGVQVAAGTPNAEEKRIELEEHFCRDVQEHHLDEVGKERRIDRQDTVKTVVSCDGDKLAGAMRRVVPFAAEGGREDLAAVYAESNNGVLELTATDGFRMAHLTISLPFPEGAYLLAVAGVKDFADRHYNGQPVNIGCFVANTLQIGEVQVPVIQKKYINYPALAPETFEVEAIIDTKKWIKAIRGSGAEKVGVVFNQAGCKMYSQGSNGETLGCDPLPVQMFSGPERKVMYKAEHFRRALTSCGATATIQVPAVGKPTLLEADDYWHVIIPLEGFPREVALTDKERETITLAEEILKSVKAGEVQGRVMIGGGKVYIEIGEQVTRTEILTVEPKLAEPPKASETP